MTPGTHVPDRRGHRDSSGLLDRHRVVIAVAAAILLVLMHLQVRDWVDRTGYFISALGLAVFLLLLVDWISDIVLPPLWRVARSIGRGVARVVSTDPELEALLGKAPRFDRWLRARLSTERWTGWYLTATVSAASWFLWLFVDIASHLALASALVAYDPGLAGLLHAIRTPELTRVMWVSTLMGQTIVVVALMVLGVGLLVMWGRYVHAAYLVGLVSTGVALQSLVKVLLHRPRPALDVMLIAHPSGYSFPSGHATASLLFFGGVAVLLVREIPTVRRRLVVLTVAALAIVMVGVSRVYLGVHWPTDVFAAWFLGLSWLVAWTGALLIFERYGPKVKAARFPMPRIRSLLTAVATLLAASALVYAGANDPVLQRETTPAALVALAVSPGPAGEPVPDQASVQRLPRFSEKLDGSRQEPIGMIFIGTRRELIAAFHAAKWHVADQATIVTVLRAAIAAALDQRYTSGPVTPTFLDGKVQDVAFQKETERPSARERHHTRFWLTRYTAGGEPVWVATASLDEGIAIGSAIHLPTHRIAPAIDVERDFIVRDLTASGLVAAVATVTVSPPVSGTNAQGDMWFTQGQAVVLDRR